MIKCKNCKYWHKKTCHLNPPVFLASNASMTDPEVRQPPTEPDDSCGQGELEETP